MDKNLTITVSGNVNTGKSTVSQLIHNMLVQNGFNVTMNLEDTPQRLEERVKALNSKVVIEIKEVNTKTEPIVN